MAPEELTGTLARIAECERLLAAEHEARRKTEVLSLLLPMVAEALDVREVFRRMSDGVQAVLPHDLMVLAFLADGRASIEAFARSTTPPPGGPVIKDMPVLESLRDESQSDTLVRDVEHLADGSVTFHVEFPPEAPDGDWKVASVPVDEARKKLVTLLRIRSSVRVRVFREGKRVGALYFNSSVPGAYDRGSMEVARRVADHVSLALAHKDLAEAAERAAEARGRADRLEEQVRTLVHDAEERSGANRIVGSSPRWNLVLKQATRVAATDTTVLLTGESGTGKEVVARHIHRSSPRANGPLVALNCAALPDQLLESELFGHERGAFSGAVATHLGRIEQAARGVLFLDEVGEMSPGVQAKLLRVLEQREFQRLGSSRTLKADVRVLGATNRDLKAAVAKGTFREDLYYRLHVFEIALPPLRERLDDVLPLAEAFLQDHGRQMGRPACGLSEEARDVLIRQRWPGNVRELRNVMERAAILCDGGLVTGEHLPFGETTRDAPRPAEAARQQELQVDVVEKRLITSALVRAKGNKSLAARLLGVSRGQLYARMERYGLKG